MGGGAIWQRTLGSKRFEAVDCIGRKLEFRVRKV